MIKTILQKILPKRFIDFYHYSLAKIASHIYKHPSEKLVVIGVTGTNGKSSTVEFIGRILEYGGDRVGWTSTAGFKVGNKEWTNTKKMTMLGRFQTHKILKDMVKAGCKYAIVETSSQGIVQSRHVGINYDVAVFTNLTPEHIESHGDFENYKEAKGKLFDVTAAGNRKVVDGIEIDKAVVVNIDDDHASYFLNHDFDHKIGFGIEGGEKGEDRRRQEKIGEERDVSSGLPLGIVPIIASGVAFSSTCTTFSIDKKDFHFNPVGEFNLKNVL